MNLKTFDAQQLRAFYIDQLKNNILPFWMGSCLDEEFGGYLNCYANQKKELLSHKKFAWSQGRFTWIFSALALMEGDIFSPSEKANFLFYAKTGAEFLRQHVFVGDSFRCNFLMERDGTALLQEGYEVYDTSIYADCFVAAGFLHYAVAASDQAFYQIGHALYLDILERVESNDYLTLPYPAPRGSDMHGIPMILLNLSTEVNFASKAFSVTDDVSIEKMKHLSSRILQHFPDKQNVLHEMFFTENTQRQKTLLGRYTNPGHTIEDFWFWLHSYKALEQNTPEQCYVILNNAIRNGWDEEYGGIYLFADCDGGMPHGSLDGIEHEEMTKQVQSNYADKVWWVHSEALYSLLLAYLDTKDVTFWSWYEKVHTYTFSTFPNPNTEEGEWIQIRNRQGNPSTKFVALPVKDPYHIIRNFILILQLLDS